MALEPQFESATELFERLKSCMQAEELIQKTVIRMNEGKQVTLDEWRKAKFDIQSAIKFKIYELNLPEKQSQDLYSHLDLSCLTDHTVTRPQFEALFNINRSHDIDFYMQEDTWKHNTQCLLFFIKGYATILQTLQVVVDADLYYADYLDSARWLQYLLTTLHETRKFFPFCYDCPQNTGEQCKLWMDVLLNLNEVLAGPRDKNHAAVLQMYFEGVDISCPIPKTLDELKRVGGV